LHIDIDDRNISRLTTTAALEHTPVFSPTDDSLLAFTSDRNGLFNLYLKNLRNGQEYAITGGTTGVSHLSWTGDGSQMTFVSFFDAGFSYASRRVATLLQNWQGASQCDPACGRT